MNQNLTPIDRTLLILQFLAFLLIVIGVYIEYGFTTAVAVFLVTAFILVFTWHL